MGYDMKPSDVLYDDESDVVAYLTLHLAQGSAHDYAASVAAVAAELFEHASEPIPPEAYAAFDPSRKWLIKNDDLKLLDALLAGIVAAAGAGFFLIPPGSPTAVPSAVAGAAIAAARVIWALKKKGADLTDDQRDVVAALRAMKTPVKADLLHKWLAYKDPSWTPARVDDCLQELTKLRFSTGKVDAVVALDGEGLWGLQDI
jgi:hypothetical protein